MARSRRKQKTAGILVVAGIVLLVLLDFIRRGEWWTLTQVGTVTIALLGIWLLFLRSTRCGYITYQKQPCRIQAPGELRGCKQYHKGLKAEALLNHLGVKHPRQRMQHAWMGNGRAASEEERPGRLERPAYDISMLLATLVSAAAAIAMPLIQMAST